MITEMIRKKAYRLGEVIRMPNLNKIKTFIKNNYFKLILIFMYVLYVGLFSFQILKSGNKSKLTILYFIIVLLLTTISYIFLIRKVLVKKKSGIKYFFGFQYY